MWTCKRRRSLSDWERAERDERRRHALWLLDHGATMAAVAAEMGVSYETVRQWRRAERAVVA